MKDLRNFSIIAHIDHGKSTLADRMLEVTGTIEARQMRDQVLDSMDLERERGITIKMQPVRMEYKEYILNLIDTPGHIDFAYEVSRAMKAVEGAILLVDATQGIQAQTLTTLSMAKELGIVIIPVVTKIDSPRARIDDVKSEIMGILGCEEDAIYAVSGKTGEGVRDLLDNVIAIVPPPVSSGDDFQSLVFDFTYSTHKGIVLHTRVFGGRVSARDHLTLSVAGENFIASEVGVFSPDEKPAQSLSSGEIGYIVTGIKKPGVASVGDTVILKGSKTKPLSGYKEVSPVVWASIYPESQDQFDDLRLALQSLRLSDSSLQFEEESSSILGRGFKCGFLGMLHLEIVTERLEREFNMSHIVTTPSIGFEIIHQNGKREEIFSPANFPDHGSQVEILEPWVKVNIMTPNDYVGMLMQLLHEHEAHADDTQVFGDGRVSVTATMPLRELMRGFFDRLKSISAGYASLSYEYADKRPADVVRLDVLVADDRIPAFSRVVARSKVQHEAEAVVEKLHKILPQQQFVAKIQGKALGRILSSRTLKAMRKDVTAKLYGGDVTRKKKLLEKQKKGKKKLKASGKVNIPSSVFSKMIRSD
jgi:GTP-binding protein LepA